jgi:hypothetical protein
MQDYRRRGGAFGGINMRPELTPLGEDIFGTGEPEQYKRSEDPLHAAAQESIEAREAGEAKKKIEELQTRKMQQDAYQSSLDPYSWLGGEGGEDPAGNLEKLRRIREQAGGTPGGGTFSQQADSPEYQARIADREAWVAEGPERDLAFLASAEQARRNPELAMSAAEQLKGLRAQKTVDRKVANQEALVAALSKGGKVPFETALQMEASGMSVPGWAVGASPDTAKGQIDRVVQTALRDMQDPMTDMAEQGYLQYVAAMGERYKQMIDAGMDPDEAGRAFMELVNRHAIESGALTAHQNRMQAQQQAQGE